MTDIEVFKKFMFWMNMVLLTKVELDSGNVCYQFADANYNTEEFTKRGYDDFEAGAIFDKDGNMVKGYLDSHVAFESDNHTIIRRILGDTDDK